MSILPAGFAKLILPFASLFSKRVFQSVQVLLAGAILAPGKRTVTSVLRIMGLSQEKHFQTYHRVLNRAVWSSLAASRILLQLLVRAFAPEGPLVFGLDDTIERRWGARIAARGIYRDPVRSSRSQVVKVSGLRWLCMMLLVPEKLVPLNWTHAMILAPLLCISGVVGDLAESVLKRCHCIKDSGHRLPGIGGILDLTDSVLFTAPVAYLYLKAIS